MFWCNVQPLRLSRCGRWRWRRRRGDTGEMDDGSGAVRLEGSKVKGSCGSTSHSDFLLSLSRLSVSDHVSSSILFSPCTLLCQNDFFWFPLFTVAFPILTFIPFSSLFYCTSNLIVEFLPLWLVEWGTYKHMNWPWTWVGLGYSCIVR